MSKAPLGVGVIGMGFMGRAFAQICRQLPEAHLVGVADTLEAAGRAAGERFGVPFYRDHADLVARPEVQAVIVATPEDAHVEPSLAALERGKAALVEKPLADTVESARRIAASAQAHRAPLLVGHVLRFTTPYVLAKQTVDAGAVGAVQQLQTRRLNGKAAQQRLHGRCRLPFFLGVHDYDVVRWFAGSEPARVYAESQCGVLQKLGYDVEDTNWALITFRNGVLAVCETGWILPDGHPSRSDGGLWIQGAEGRLDVDLLYQGLRLATGERTSYPGTVFMPEVYGEIRAGFVDEVQHFLACARGEKEPLITAEDAVAAVRIAEAVIESARSHQPVML